MDNQRSATDQRKQKFLLALPLIALPFLTLFFWAMGGGKLDEANANENKQVGLNSNLPDVHLKEKEGLDKMSYYDQAARDSVKLKESLGNERYSQNDSGSGSFPFNVATDRYELRTSPYSGSGYRTSTDAAVYRKIEELNRTLNQPDAITNDPYSASYTAADQASLQRLEKMMMQMQSGSSAADPETEQLDGMLDKVLDIQYPDRIRDKLQKSSQQHRGQVFAVSAAGHREYISELKSNGGGKTSAINSFYSLDEPASTDTMQNAIDAVIAETQIIVNGSTVKLRLGSDVCINGKLIPKDNFLYGKASLEGERLNIKISGIRYGKNLFPVELSVFDIDGMPGIYIPGAIARDVAKESADRAIQDVSFGSASTSLGIQAASAGVEAAKSLFSKKIKLIKVQVKAGYKVLLRDEKQKQDLQ